MTGITGNFVEVGTDLELTCTISRIRPEATEMYWMIGDQRDNGSDVQADPNGDGTFRQSTTLLYT